MVGHRSACLHFKRSDSDTTANVSELRSDPDASMLIQAASSYIPKADVIHARTMAGCSSTKSYEAKYLLHYRSATEAT